MSKKVLSIPGNINRTPFTSPLSQLCNEILERRAQFFEECTELQQNLFANFSFHRVAQTGGRERCSTKKSEMNAQQVDAVAPGSAIGCLKTSDSSIFQPEKKRGFFDFRVAVEGLLAARWCCRAGKLLYSRVLQENTKKSDRKSFLVKKSRSDRDSGLALGNLPCGNRQKILKIWM